MPHTSDFNGWFKFTGYIDFDGDFPTDFQIIDPEKLESTAQFGALEVEPGEVRVYPAKWTSSGFGVLQLNMRIYPGRVESTNRFGVPQLTRGKTLLRQLARLPHYYNTDHLSNNAKIISLVSDEIDEITETQSRSEIWRVNIDESRGKTLDLIGSNILQYRGNIRDVDYKLWLFAKLVAVTSLSELSSHNRAMEFIACDAFLALYESWANTLRLNQTAPDGYYLNGKTKLDGLDWETEVDEPAAVIVEIEHQKFFKMIMDRYRDIAGDEGLEPYLADVMVITERVRAMMELVKAGGVGMFWESHVPGLEPVNAETDENAATIKINPAAVTNIAFGDAGHYTTKTGSFEPGDAIVPTGLEVEVYGEHTQLPLMGENVQIAGLNHIILTAYIERDEMNGETISSIGIYDAADDLVAIKNIHPFVKDDKTRVIINWIISGLFFNGSYKFDGEIYFEGAA